MSKKAIPPVRSRVRSTSQQKVNSNPPFLRIPNRISVHSRLWVRLGGCSSITRMIRCSKWQGEEESEAAAAAAAGVGGQALGGDSSCGVSAES
jgi:hypothetical protein